MKLSTIPTRVPLPFADSGSKRAIPEASQIGVTPGAASLTDGFPPLTFTPLAAGGVPPSGKDFNGILNLLSANTQWQDAGAFFTYDSAFSTSIGGYPKSAILVRSDGNGFWLSTADDNTADPATDTSGAWVPILGNGITSVALSGTNVTLTPDQYGLRVVTFTGTLTANVQVTFPALTGVRWLLINQTTGAYTLTCTTSSGTGITLDQGAVQEVYSDGTNIALASAAVAGNSGQTFAVANATAADEAMALGQGDGRYALVAGNSGQTFAVANATAADEAVALAQSTAGATTQLVTSSRSISTTYTNSTSRLKIVAVAVNSGSSGYADLAGYVDGVVIIRNEAPVGNSVTSITFGVPPGSTYSVNVPSNLQTLLYWTEWS